jgi:putative polyhydroxyalkanoate system protein
MPRITIDHDHPLTKEEALTRLQGFARRLALRFGNDVSDLRHEWYGNVMDVAFRVRGQKVDGTVHVEANRVTCHINVPLVAMMFRAKAEKAIHAELDKLLRT